MTLTANGRTVQLRQKTFYGSLNPDILVSVLVFAYYMADFCGARCSLRNVPSCRREPEILCEDALTAAGDAAAGSTLI
jgi:hypothetical protein